MFWRTISLGAMLVCVQSRTFFGQAQNLPDAVASSNTVDITVLWAKVHRQCVGKGREHAVRWIQNLMERTRSTFAAKRIQLGDGLLDFLSVAELQGAAVASTHPYASAGAACSGWAHGPPPHMIGIYYHTERWELQRVYPSSAQGGPCTLTALNAEMETGRPLCKLPAMNDAGALSHDWGACCACTDHPGVSPTGNLEGIGHRPFIAARFQHRAAGGVLCVIAASLPHPYPDNCDGKNFKCKMNGKNTSVFGTVTLHAQVEVFCNGAEIIFLSDTNLAHPAAKLQDIFPVGPLSKLSEDPRREFTCCYDGPEKVNRYAADRIGATNAVSVSTLGGSSHRGPMTVHDSLPFQAKCQGADASTYGFICCGSSKEHSPLVSSIRMVLSDVTLLTE